MILIKPSYEILWMSGSPYKDIEKAARTCYKSEDKINEDSAPKLVRMLKERKHEAMIEFADMTVKFVCDRGVSHELVRHRMCSFAQESTRYCNYSTNKFGSQLTFIIPMWYNLDEKEYAFDEGSVIYFEEVGDEKRKIVYNSFNERKFVWLKQMLYSELSYLQLIEMGESPQQARSVLPNSLKTEIVVKANMREWIHIFKLRTSEAAHPQMREIMVPLYRFMAERYPDIFSDINPAVL